MKRNKKHGIGTLVKRGRTWYARWQSGKTPDGKPRIFTRTTGETDKTKAQKRLEEFTADFLADSSERVLERVAVRLGAVRMEREEKENARPALPLADAFGVYASGLEHDTWAELTERIYTARAAAFVAWMKEHFPRVSEMREVTPEHAAEYMREIRAKSSNKTFNEYRLFFSHIWRALEDNPQARLTVNPWKKIKPLELRTHSRRELTVEELARVISPLEGEMKTLFAIGIYTGLRLGDCVRLEWGRIDLVRGFIILAPHKTEKHGTIVKIPVSPILARILEETPPSRRRGPVIPGILAEYTREPSAFSSRIQRLFRDAGIKTSADTGRPRRAVEVGFHSLRHTFVSLSANAGIPLAVVQSIVGHTSARMTEHYFHVADTSLRAAAESLPDITGNGPAAPARIGLDRLAAFRSLLNGATPEEKAEFARILAAETKEIEL